MSRRRSDSKPNKPLPLRRVQLPPAGKLLPYLRAIDRANWYTNFGAQTLALERRLAVHFASAPQCLVTAASGTAALAAALLATEAPRGSYCAVPSFTFTGTTAAVLMAGLRPWFVDVDPDSWALDPNAVTEYLRRPPGAVSAAVPVSPFGAPLAHAHWRDFAARTGIHVVIDGAWCFDSAREISVAIMISMHATKVLGVGEGAFLVASDEDFAARTRSITNYGIEGYEGSVRIGANFKMSEYAAAIGQAALDAWPRRREAAMRVKRWYLEALQDLRGAALLPGYERDWVSAACPVRFDRPVARQISARLAAERIESRMWWGTPCHRLRAYREFPATAQVHSEWLAERVLCVPFYDAMTQGDVKRVVRVLKGALAAV